MPIKKYFFDFYECSTRNSNPNVEKKTTSSIIKLIYDRKTHGNSTVKEIARRNYELRSIDETDFGFRGVIGKHRENDLPHAAVIGGEEREIELAPNENLLEKAHFHFYEDYQLLILQRNHFCISSNNFGKYLSEAGHVTSLNPVIETADLQWLMSNNIQVRTAQIAIARPRNPELFQNIEHDFNNSIISTLNGSGTAMLNLSLRGNAHSGDPEERYLSWPFKRAIREMQATFDVRKCKLLLENEENQMTHPVDLVADRLFFNKEVNVDGRYPPAFEMWRALSEARVDREDELINYFGDLDAARLD